MSFASWSSSRHECSASTIASCPNHAQAVSDRAAALTEATISTVSFVAAGAALAGGAFLFFSAPTGAVDARVSLAPGVTTRSAGLIFSGAF
jgi:hypothetical protein